MYRILMNLQLGAVSIIEKQSLEITYNLPHLKAKLKQKNASKSLPPSPLCSIRVTFSPFSFN